MAIKNDVQELSEILIDAFDTNRYYLMSDLEKKLFIKQVAEKIRERIEYMDLSENCACGCED